MKNILLFLLISLTTVVFSQKKKTSSKSAEEKKATILTESKNLIKKGNELYVQGNYVKADEAYKKAIALNPTYDKANYNYGNTQYLQNKMKEAKVQYELVSKTTTDKFIKADSKHNLGNVAMKDKKYKEAIETYKESLRNNPNDDETRYNLALAQKLQKEKEDKEKKDKDKKKDDKKNKDKDDKKKDKDKDKKKDDKKDKDKDDKKDDKKDDPKDKKNDKEKGDKDKKEQQQKPKPKPSKLSPEQVKQLLEAMNKEDNKTQKKMNARKAKGRKVKQDKDW